MIGNDSGSDSGNDSGNEDYTIPEPVTNALVAATALLHSQRISSNKMSPVELAVFKARMEAQLKSWKKEQVDLEKDQDETNIKQHNEAMEKMKQKTLQRIGEEKDQWHKEPVRSDRYRDLVKNGTDPELMASYIETDGTIRESPNGTDMPTAPDTRQHTKATSIHQAVDGISHKDAALGLTGTALAFCPLVSWDPTIAGPKYPPVVAEDVEAFNLEVTGDIVQCKDETCSGRVVTVDGVPAAEYAATVHEKDADPDAFVTIEYHPKEPMPSSKIHGAHMDQYNEQGQLIATLLTPTRGGGNVGRWPPGHSCVGRRVFNFEGDVADHWIYGIFISKVSDESECFNIPLEMVTCEEVVHDSRSEITVARGRGMHPLNANATIAVEIEKKDPSLFLFAGLKTSFCQLKRRGQEGNRVVITPEMLWSDKAKDMEELRLQHSF